MFYRYSDNPYNSGIPIGIDPKSNPETANQYPLYRFFPLISILAFSHRFEIIDCDQHVKNWIDANGSSDGSSRPIRVVLEPEFVDSITAHLSSA